MRDRDGQPIFGAIDQQVAASHRQA
jgi:hypothetical protein